MKALGYFNAHPLETFSIQETVLPMPAMRPNDILIQVKAIAVNPVDTKVRKSRSAEGSTPVVLGWDAAGVVMDQGVSVQGFRKGDEVYYAGELMRPGCNAEYQAVDHRLTSLKPKSVSFSDAASLPLTALTAYEMLFEQFLLPKDDPFDLLIIGGAGGVGSIAIQLAKTLTKGRVFSTSGRDFSKDWLTSLGVDGVLDRHSSLLAEMERLNIPHFDYVFSTTHTDEYLHELPQVLRPFGRLGLIDDPGVVDVSPLKRKSIQISWEFMFAKSMFGYRPETQGRILAQLARWVDEKRIRPTANSVLRGLTVDNLRRAHEELERGTAIGKIVITF